MIRRPPRSTLFPTRRSSDLQRAPAQLLPGLDRLALRRAHRVAAPEARRRGGRPCRRLAENRPRLGDRKSTRLNSSHSQISYAVFCLKKKKKQTQPKDKQERS